MIDCKVTANFLKELRRAQNSGKLLLPNMNMPIDEQIKIVQQWSNSHPIKTYLSDFMEKYPNASKVTDNICIDDVFGTKYYNLQKCSDCIACWNRPLKECEK